MIYASLKEVNIGANGRIILAKGFYAAMMDKDERERERERERRGLEYRRTVKKGE